MEEEEIFPFGFFNLNNTNQGVSSVNCPSSDHSREHLISQVQFWVEGVSLSVVAILGTVGNVLSTVVLSHPDLRNSFNLLLIGLAIYDTVYVIVSLLETFRKCFDICSELHLRLYPYVIYPSQMISLTGSVFLIVVISFERYISVHYPLDYNQAMNDNSAVYKRFWKFLGPVIFFSIFFNFPKFFETKVVNVSENSTNLEIDVTKMRLSPTYSAYVNWSEFFVLGAVPVILLVYFNAKIYQDIREREKRWRRPEPIPLKRRAGAICFLRSSPPSSGMTSPVPSGEPPRSVAVLNNNVRRRSAEDKMARLFMTIVLLFLICHCSRITLNFYEMFTLQSALECARMGLPLFSLWAELMISFSHFILVVNSSANIFIYGAFNPQFRKTAKKIWWKLIRGDRQNVQNSKSETRQRCRQGL